jgi:hypothetical protein
MGKIMNIQARMEVPIVNQSGIGLPGKKGEIGGVVFGNDGVNNIVVLETGAALTFFREYAMRRPRLIDDALGIYSYGSIGRMGKVKWNTISTPLHILQARSESCTWNPKGHIVIEGEELLAKGLEINMEFCNKDILDMCTRGLFGTGADINKIIATPEGEQLFNLLMEAIYTAKGNSIYDLVTFGDHPYIWAAELSGVYGIPADEFADYIDQMAILGGHLTMVDFLKASGHPQYTIPITNAEVNQAEFVGDTFEVLQRVKAKTPVRMMSYINMARSAGKPGIFLVSPAFFNKYEADLTAANMLNQAQVIMNGIYPDAGTAPGVLKFGGDYVVNRADWGEFDTIVQMHTHRVMYVAPGALGIAYDIPILEQFGQDKAGLIVEHSTRVSDKNKTYVYGEMEIGAGLVDKSMIVNASITVPFGA